MGIWVQLVLGKRVFVKYVIIIYQNWTKYIYMYLLIKPQINKYIFKVCVVCK